jgi:cell division protein ZapB
MAESEFSKLERRIDDLIALTDQLSGENKLMRERQSQLLEERARLTEKAELARNRVESMLVRLKSMEAKT